MAPSGNTLTLTTPTERQIVITRVFDAPRDLVFEAHTSCEHLKNWWGPRRYEVGDCEVDFARGVLGRGGNRIKPRLQRIERGNQLRKGRPGGREAVEQIEQVGVHGSGPRITLRHGLEDHRFAAVESPRGQYLDRLVRGPPDLARR